MTISVCIPTYNQAEYLEECIGSVMKQTLPANEVIVSNDCSIDNTKQVLDDLADKIPILKVIHQPQNLGITANTNACFKIAKGDYIIRVDSDDMLYPDYTSVLSEMLDKYPAAGYAHCAIQEIDKKGNLLQQRKLYRHEMFENDINALKNCLNGYKVAANIVMFRRQSLEQTGFLKCTYNFAEDYYLAADMAAHGFGNVYSPKVLAMYRIWKDIGNMRVRRKLEEIKGLISVFDEVIEPVFIAKNYNLREIEKSRKRFAIAQADCLSWKIFNAQDKHILKSTLRSLSSSRVAKFSFYLYENNLHLLPAAFKKIKINIKRLIKNMVMPTRTNEGSSFSSNR